MQVTTFEGLSANRPAFKNAFPHLYPQHREVQKAMFSAAHEAHLPTETSAMLEAINELLGLALTSRTQLSISEMEATKAAIEKGDFGPDWAIRDDWSIGLFSLSDIELNAMEAPVDYDASPCLGFATPSQSTPASLEVVEIQNRLADAAREYEEQCVVMGARLLERKIELRSRIDTLNQVMRDNRRNMSEGTCDELRRMRNSAIRELNLLDDDYPTI